MWDLKQDYTKIPAKSLIRLEEKSDYLTRKSKGRKIQAVHLQ